MLTPKDPWFESGIQLKSLTELHSTLIEVNKCLELVRTGGSN